MFCRGLFFTILIFLTGIASGSDTKQLYKHGVDLIRLKQYDEAVSDLEQALQNRDVLNLAPIYYFIGIALFEKKDYENSRVECPTDQFLDDARLLLARNLVRSQCGEPVLGLARRQAVHGCFEHRQDLRVVSR